MYQLSFCELGLKLAVIRSEQKWDNNRRTTGQHPESSAISAPSLAWLGWAGAGLGWAGSGLGWAAAGLGWAAAVLCWAAAGLG